MNAFLERTLQGFRKYGPAGVLLHASMHVGLMRAGNWATFRARGSNNAKALARFLAAAQSFHGRSLVCICTLLHHPLMEMQHEASLCGRGME